MTLIKTPRKTATRHNVPELSIKLTTKQRDVFMSPANEIFFGGAAGPGKSFLLRVLAIYYALNIPKLQAYLIRRISPDLKKNHLEGITGFRSLLDPWVRSGHAAVTDVGFKLWHGSACFLDHCEEEKDKQKYQGPEINLLLPDELTHFTESQYRFIRGRVRLGSLRHTIPPEYRAKMSKGLIVAASNPGNIGHEWVKRTFVDVCPPDGTPVQMPKSEGGKIRAFFQALMTDNPYLEEDYADTLDGLGSADLVKAMKEGDWNVLQGAFFSEFSRMRHFIPPFKIPVHWTRIMGCDWGYWYPFCISWWAVAAEDFEHPQTKVRIPFNSLVCYRQWYGCEKPGSNLGLQMDPEVVARKIKEIESSNEGPPDYRFGDPEMWKSDQKATVASLFRKRGIRFSKADNTHSTGYIELKRRLSPAQSTPEIYWFNTCEDTARCFTNAVCDEKNPTEINKNCEVHACDEARYVVMAAQAGFATSQRREIVEINTDMTYGALIKAADELESRASLRKGPLEC